jgi:hypothetical protein
MKILSLLFLSLTGLSCHAQTAKINLNEDGTQSTVIKNGNITTIVNQDGTQRTLVNNGNSAIIVNTDGTQTTFTKAGNMTTMVSSKGSATTLIDNGATLTIAKNGTLTTVPKDETITGFTDADGIKYQLSGKVNGYVINKVDEKLYTVITSDAVTTEVAEGKVSSNNIKNGYTLKVKNADGTYTSITRDGNSYTEKTAYTVIKDGNTSTIKNPDGTEVTTINPNAPPAVTKTVSIIATTNQTGEPAIGIAASYNKIGKVVSHYSSTTTTTHDSGPPPNYWAEKAIANYLKRPTVEFAVIANESAPGMSKFEINLYSDKHGRDKRDMIWLSLKSSSVKDLTDARYIFSMKNADIRSPFTFYGSVSTAGIQDAINEGSFTLKKNNKEISIDFTLRLLSGKTTTGKYTGSYKVENRSTNIP